MTSGDLIWHAVAMPTEDAITPARQRLGRLIEDRRESLGLTQRDVAPHSVTFGNLVAGRPVKRETLRRAFRALGWDPDSVQNVLDGGNPRPLSGSPNDPMRSSDTEGEVRVAFDVGGRVISGWPAMSDEDRQRIIDAVDEAYKRM